MKTILITIAILLLVISAYAGPPSYGAGDVGIVGTVDTIQKTVGSGFYAIKDTAIAGTSQNFPFGFTSQIVAIETPTTNTDEVCIDWLGGTAVCPSADTAGDDRLQPGTTLIIDFMGVTSLSAISNSGSQTVYIRAWE